jgi:MYXO-CTERM domain-containing protein
MFSPRKTGLLLAAVGLGLAAHPAAAQVIYQDNFSTGTAGSINGQKPSTDPSNATYTVLSSDNFSGSANGASDIAKTGAAGPASFVLDTPTAANQPPGLVNAFLPYAVTAAGPTVTLSATYAMPSDATWFAMGFAPNATTSQFGSASTTPAGGTGPWILVRGNGQYQVFAGPGVGNNLVSNGTGLGTGGGIFSETLNPATNTLSASFNGTPFYTTTLAGLPTINNVFFGEYVDNTTLGGRTISSFSVVAAPEPSQTAVLAVGLLGLAALSVTARRRRLGI